MPINEIKPAPDAVLTDLLQEARDEFVLAASPLGEKLAPAIEAELCRGRPRDRQALQHCIIAFRNLTETLT